MPHAIKDSSARPVRIAVKTSSARGSAATSSKSDAADISAGANNKKVEVWFDSTGADQMQKLSKDELKAFLDQAFELQKLPGLTSRSQGMIDLMISGAYGLLAKAGEDKIDNGKRSFKAAKGAFDLYPTQPDIVRGYARAIYVYINLSGFERWVVGSPGVDTRSESRRLLPALAAYPENAIDVLIRIRLAGHCHDQDAKEAAERDLAALEAKNPQAVEAAKVALGLAKPQEQEDRSGTTRPAEDTP